MSYWAPRNSTVTRGLATHRLKPSGSETYAPRIREPTVFQRGRKVDGATVAVYPSYAFVLD